MDSNNIFRNFTCLKIKLEIALAIIAELSKLRKIDRNNSAPQGLTLSDLI